MGKPLRALIIGPSENDAALLAQELRCGGYEVEFEHVASREAAAAALRRQRWDILLCNCALPHFMGTEALELVKRMKLDVPFIFVSDVAGEEAAVAAMKAGAHDYLMKNNLKRLVPAVERELREVEARRAQRSAEESQQQFMAILDSTPDFVSILDVSGRTRYLNRGGRKLLGVGDEEDISQIRVTDYYPQWAARIVTNDAIPTAVRNGSWSGEAALVSRDGREIPVSLVILGHKTPDGMIELVSIIARDITERKKTEQELAYLAQYDMLTDLPNRTLFRDRLTQAMARAARNRQLMALMFLDLDRFKQINDTLGHAAGDTVLQQVARRLREMVRGADTIARLGGDEFTLILEWLKDKEQAARVAQKILDTFAEPFSLEIERRKVFTTASIGIALYPCDAMSGREDR